MNLIDKLIVQADQALRTLVPGSVTAAEANPADQADSAQLDATRQRHAAGLMRINHCGEVCAQALYQGQALTAKLPEVRTSMEQAAQEEFDHLAWCESRLKELDSRPSVLNPLFYGLSYGIGALAGLAGVVAAPFLSLSPSMSADVIIDSFVVVVIGGLGSLAGAFVAALVLGMVQAIGAVYLPDAAVLLPFVFMIAILIWKPSGFAGSRT